jgi:serine/threonine protein kinase
MIHRDIKLENILVTDKGVVKLADFGLATYFRPDDPTAVGCVGTHSYQAPEILIGVPYTASVDMWAFGVALYVLLSAKKPFPKEGSNRALQRSKILNGEFDFYGEAWRNISDDAKDLITKSLVLRPAERITSAEALEHPWMKTPLNLKTFGERWASKLELRKKVNSSIVIHRNYRQTGGDPNTRSRARSGSSERSHNSIISSRLNPAERGNRAERSQGHSLYSHQSSVSSSASQQQQQQQQQQREKSQGSEKPHSSHIISHNYRSHHYSEPSSRNRILRDSPASGGRDYRDSTTAAANRSTASAAKEPNSRYNDRSSKISPLVSRVAERRRY